MFLFLLSLPLGLLYLQIKTDCTFIKTLPCRTFPIPLLVQEKGWSKENWSQELGYKKQHSSVPCPYHCSPTLTGAWAHRRATRLQWWAAASWVTKGMVATGNSENHCMVSKFHFLLMELFHGHCTVLNLCFI